MIGTTLSEIARVAGFDAADLAPLAGRGRTTVYRHLMSDPPPLWLLKAVWAWYEQKKPLQPAWVDAGFKQEMKKVCTATLGEIAGVLADTDPEPTTPGGKGRSRHRGEAKGGKLDSSSFPPHHQHQTAAASLTQEPTCHQKSPSKPPISGPRGNPSSAEITPLPPENQRACIGSIPGISLPSESNESQTIKSALTTPCANGCLIASPTTLPKTTRSPRESSEDSTPSTTPESTGSKSASTTKALATTALARAVNTAKSVSAARWDTHHLADKNYAAKVWFDLTDSIPNVLQIRKRFKADVFAIAPAWLRTQNDNALVKVLARAMPRAQLRARDVDEGRAERAKQLANYVLVKAAPIEAAGHQKSAYQFKSWSDLRATILAFWDQPEHRAKVAEIYGKDISYGTLEKLFREEFGKVSPMERAAKDYFAECVGVQTDYAGQHIQLDGTGIPISVLRGFGRRKNNGDMVYNAAFLTDVASLRTLIKCEAVPNENVLWSPLLERFFEQEEYAPERITMDEGGRGFVALRHQNAGEPLTLSPGIKLALAAGVLPHCHRPGHSQAKGSVESGGVKSGKSALKRVLAGRFMRAVLTELKAAPKSYRDIESQIEFLEIHAEWEALLNARVLKRVGDGTLQRAQIWSLPEYVAKRAERALVADWRDKRADILSRGFCMEVRGDRVLHWNGARAELITPLGRPVERGATAILFPGGLRAGDEGNADLLRGVIVEETKGSPRYHAIEALKVKKTFLGFEADRPTFTEHPIAKPETDAQRRARAWHEAGHPKITQPEPVLADGTNGRNCI